jgi:predicted dehydrogenase
MPPRTTVKPRGCARVAVVGSGAHIPTSWTTARMVLDLQSVPGCQLVALVEPDRARREQAAASLGIPAAFSTVLDMLAARQRGMLHVDGCFVFSSPAEHFAHVHACVTAGLHVLVKEPLVVSTSDRNGPAEARTLAAAASEAGVTLMVTAPLSYGGACQKACELVSAGRLGTIEHLVCHMEGPLRSHAEPLTAAHPLSASVALGGGDNPSGYMWGQLSHLLAWVFRVSPDLRAEQCFAFLGCDRAGVDAYDAVTVRCSNGATMVISGAATAPNHGRLGDFSVRIFGSAGVLEFTNNAGFASDHTVARLCLRCHDGTESCWGPAELAGSSTSALTPPASHHDGATATQALRSFVETSRGSSGSFVGAGPEACVRVVETIDAMHRSATCNLPVHIDPGNQVAGCQHIPPRNLSGAGPRL